MARSAEVWGAFIAAIGVNPRRQCVVKPYVSPRNHIAAVVCIFAEQKQRRMRCPPGCWYRITGRRYERHPISSTWTPCSYPYVGHPFLWTCAPSILLECGSPLLPTRALPADRNVDRPSCRHALRVLTGMPPFFFSDTRAVSLLACGPSCCRSTRTAVLAPRYVRWALCLADDGG